MFNPSKDKELNAVYIIAEYGENGKLLDFRQEIASVPAYGFGTFKLTASDGRNTVRAYLWDANTYVPLAASAALILDRAD